MGPACHDAAGESLSELDLTGGLRRAEAKPNLLVQNNEHISEDPFTGGRSRLGIHTSYAVLYLRAR